MKTRVLFVDDSEKFLHDMKGLLESLGSYRVTGCPTAESAWHEFEAALKDDDPFQLVIVDVGLPRKAEMKGIHLARRIKAHESNEYVYTLIITGNLDEDVSEAAWKHADDFLIKAPIMYNPEWWKERLDDAERKRYFIEQGRLCQKRALDSIVGECDAMKRVKLAIMEIAPDDELSVLIRGESGTGKELVARAIHELSPRAAARFIEKNCTDLPDSLVSGLLFGHERGIFTGAEKRGIGIFEMCPGGTLFLDEIGDASVALQGNLLRVLETKEVTRLGGEETISVDVRFVFATCKNLEEEVKAGRFRSDLFFRLDEIPIFLPPLRERGEGDLKLLCDALSKKEVIRKGGRRRFHTFDQAALDILVRHQWPGNVRELKNIIRRLYARATPDHDVFSADDVRAAFAANKDARGVPGDSQHPGLVPAARALADLKLLPDIKAAYELGRKIAIHRAMRAAQGNKSKAAREWGDDSIDGSNTRTLLKQLVEADPHFLERSEDELTGG
jgi:DNA-binding NtrC family response regulator